MAGDDRSPGRPISGEHGRRQRVLGTVGSAGLSLGVTAVVGLIVSALLGAFAGSGQKASDEKPTPLSGPGFNVNMPGTPKRSVTTAQTAAGPAQTTSYVSDGADAFAISITRIPTGSSVDLNLAVKNDAAIIHGAVTHAVRTTYEGFPARDARLTTTWHGIKRTFFTRLIFAKGTLWDLRFIAPGDAVNAPPHA
jgi:hypothetical protein